MFDEMVTVLAYRYAIDDFSEIRVVRCNQKNAIYNNNNSSSSSSSLLGP